jgi:rubrerythrin
MFNKKINCKMENIIREEIEQLRELAHITNQGISFCPEKSVQPMLLEYSNDLTKFLETIPEVHHDWVKVEYINLLSSWWYAKSRCISPVITGPAKFPVKRALKLNSREQEHYKAFKDWRNSIAGKLVREEKKAAWTIIKM